MESMNQMVWLEQLVGETSQLAYVKDTVVSSIFEQSMPLNAGYDEHRSRFFYIAKTPEGAAELVIITPSAEQIVSVLLPSDQNWVHVSQSASSDLLLFRNSSENDTSSELLVICVNDGANQAPSIYQQWKAPAALRIIGPRFIGEKVGFFIGHSADQPLRFFRWDLSKRETSEPEALEFPPVLLAVADQWMTDANEDRIYLVCRLPEVRRQQLVCLSVHHHQPTNIGPRLPVLDAIAFDKSTMRMLHADSSGLKSIALHNGTVQVLADAHVGRIESIRIQPDGTCLLQTSNGVELRLLHFNPATQTFYEVYSTSHVILNWGAMRKSAFARVKTANHHDLIALKSGGLSRECDFSDDSSDQTVSDASTEQHLVVPNVVATSTTVAESIEHANDAPRQSAAVHSVDTEGEKHLDDSSDRRSVECSVVTDTVSDGKTSEEFGSVNDSASKTPEAVVPADGSKDMVEDMTPERDFVAWVRHIGDSEDPEAALRILKDRRNNDVVLGQSVRHLQHCLEALSSDEELVLDAIVAIAAVAELRAQQARSILESICLGARRRLLEEGTLPFVEEHFSLAALRALGQPTGRFSLVTVYEEYEKLIARVTDGELSERQRKSLLKKTSLRYRRALEHVLFDSPKEHSLNEPSEDGDLQSPVEPKSVPLPQVDHDSGSIPELSAAPAVDDLAYRFQPLARNFPAGARPLRPNQPQGAAITDRASSDMIRIDDFGPAGDEQFFADDFEPTRSHWVKKVLILLSALGGFCALVMVMLGFSYLPLLVIGGGLLAVGSVMILGDRTVQWVIGWLGFVVAGLTFFATPSLATNLPQSMSSLLFFVLGGFCVSFAVILFHPSIRSHFAQVSRLENELD